MSESFPKAEDQKLSPGIKQTNIAHLWFAVFTNGFIDRYRKSNPKKPN